MYPGEAGKPVTAAAYVLAVGCPAACRKHSRHMFRVQPTKSSPWGRKGHHLRCHYIIPVPVHPRCSDFLIVHSRGGSALGSVSGGECDKSARNVTRQCPARPGPPGKRTRCKEIHEAKKHHQTVSHEKSMDRHRLSRRGRTPLDWALMFRSVRRGLFETTTATGGQEGKAGGPSPMAKHGERGRRDLAARSDSAACPTSPVA